jgi:predicted MFS family arabinose efflux permease
VKSLSGSWPLLVLLSAGRYLAFVARLNIVPFYPELMARFATTYTGAGALLSAFFLGYIASLIPAGSAADRWSPNRQIVLGFLVMATSGVVVAMAASYGAALAARVVLGLSVAMVYTASLKLVATRFARETRGRAVGVMEMSTGLGMLTALTVLPVLSQWTDYRHLLLSLPVMCLAVLALFPLIRPAHAASSRGSDRAAAPLRALFDRNLAYITLTALLGLFIVTGVLGWLPTHLTQGLGYTKAGAGIVNGVVLAGQMLGVYPAGSLSDRLRRRLPLVFAGTLVLVVAVLGLVVARGGAAMYALAFVLGLGLSCSVTPLTILTMELYGSERAGVISAVAVASAQAGSGLAGVLFGWVLDQTGQFTAVWLTAAALGVLRLITISRIREDPPAGGGGPVSPPPL